jgi:dienelactone hydrolase
MQTRLIEYTHGKIRFIGQLFWDETQDGRRPGVLVFPDAFGLHEHARERAKRLVQLGYVALAVDPYGEGRVFSDVRSVAPISHALVADRPEWRSQLRAAYDALITQPQVDGNKTAAIGFCFGGSSCLELARSGAPLAAVATFHGSFLPELPEDAGRIRAKVLVCHGAEDPLMKKETMETVMAELRRDKVDWQVIYYGNTVHSFTDPEADNRNIPGLAYNNRTEVRSWSAMRDLFAEIFD